MLAGVDTMVLYTSPGADLLLGGSQAEQVETLLRRGVGLVALHWATGVHGTKENEIGRRFLKHMGGLFCFEYCGLDVSESRLHQTEPSHPICRGWGDFDLTDEYYLNLKFLPEARPILNVPVKGKDQTVGWVYERPNSNGGRSYGNTLGHFHTLFCQESFRRMLVNGILWTAHYEVPSAGAPCAMAEEDKDPPSKIDKTTIGNMPDGTEVQQYTLTNVHGLEVKVLTYGARITSVRVPDRDGKLDSVTLFFDPPTEYLKKRGVMGTIVGRFANRIAGAKFTLDGTEHSLTANARAHHIHGGKNGFHTLVWHSAPFDDGAGPGVRLVHSSPDGDEGYPGKLDTMVVYQLTNENQLKMEYLARADKPTHVNLTNHAYWNLAGTGSDSVLEHELTLHADHYLVGDEVKMPTGEIRRVDGTEMDFSEPKTIGSRVEEVEYGYYDHCYVLNKPEGDPLPLAARVVEPESGRVMEVFTTQPGVQLYTGNQRGFCLETQHYPNTPNEPSFPTTVLRPGETYREVTIHKFSVQE